VHPGFGQECSLTAEELEQLTAQAQDTDGRKAKGAAHKQWEQLCKSEFAPDKNAARPGANAKALDVRIGNGPTLVLGLP